VANFEITNPTGYKSYVPAVVPTLEAHGAEILVADYETEPLEGKPASVTVVIRFASKEALHAWHQSPEYQEILHLRTENAEGIVVAASEFDLEKNLRILESL
jgi:uncharacterized protein (DUF1330 family)